MLQYLFCTVSFYTGKKEERIKISGSPNSFHASTTQPTQNTVPEVDNTVVGSIVGAVVFAACFIIFIILCVLKRQNLKMWFKNRRDSWCRQDYRQAGQDPRTVPTV